MEPRFSPHLLAGSKISAEEATKTILDALERGGALHDLQWKAILCMFRANPEWSDEVVAIAKKFQSQGVVAVDVAGRSKWDTAYSSLFRPFEFPMRRKFVHNFFLFRYVI